MNKEANSNRPVVFLAAGIGVTPLLSMAKSLVHRAARTPIHFIHASINSRTHALASEVRELAHQATNVTTHFLYSDPLPGDLAQRRCDRAGKVNKAFLEQSTPYLQASYYLCGPKPFMQSVLQALEELGVDNDRIHFEFFGPKQDLVPVPSGTGVAA